MIGPVATGISGGSALVFLLFAARFVLERTKQAARALFLVSTGFLLLSMMGAAAAAAARL